MTKGIKVRARILADGRVHPNVIAPNGKRKLVQTIPDRLIEWPENSFDGAYVLLLPTEEDQAKLAKNAATAQDALHCTSAYLGSASDIKVDGAKIAEALRMVASETEPIKATLGGIIRFSVDNDYKLDPVVLNVDSPKVNEARETILRRMRHDFDIEPDDEHGYTPHMTLGYMPHSEPLVANRLEPTTVIFDRIRLGFGGKEFDIRLGKRAADDDRLSKEPQMKAFLLNPLYGKTEHKVRHVRTLAGVRRFGLPIGSAIVSDPVSEFPSRAWEDDTEHSSRVETADDALFKNYAVHSPEVREAMKDDIATDLSRRLEEDLDIELLNRIEGIDGGQLSDEAPPFTDVSALRRYLNDFAYMAKNFDYWTQTAQNQNRKAFGVPNNKAPAEHFQKLTGRSPEDFPLAYSQSTDEGVAAMEDLLATGRVLDHKSSASAVRYNTVNTFIAEWASSSKDYNMQMRAGEQFDLKDAQVNHLEEDRVTLLPMSERNFDDDQRAAWEEAYDYYLDAVYESTQERLAEANITEVAVYRGMTVAPEDYKARFGASIDDMRREYQEASMEWHLASTDLRNRYTSRREELLFSGGRDPNEDDELEDLLKQRQDMANKYLEAYWERLRDMGVEPEVISMLKNSYMSTYEPTMPQDMMWAALDSFKPNMELDIGTQPLSSWTTDPEVASRFGNYVYKVIVPAERVWSTALTGAGCLNEKELILVGGIDKGKVQTGGSL